MNCFGLLEDADKTMPRKDKSQSPKTRREVHKQSETAQLSLNTFLEPTYRAGDVPNPGGLALLLSAAEESDRVSINNTDAGIDEEIALDTNRTVSTVTQAVPGDRVVRAQNLIADARPEGEIKQRAAIDDAIQLLYGYPPREGQRDALHHLIYLRKDLILIAKTSFGKSMIFQAVSVLLDKTTSIIILPLNQIGKEQAQYIEQIGGRPCFLNTDSISEGLLKGVITGTYTHVLMSPELAISEKFRPTLLDPKFKSQLALIVVDEAHLVSQWGRAFRTNYARLNLLRTLLGYQVPWFACSATLDKETLDALIRGVGFDADQGSADVN